MQVVLLRVSIDTGSGGIHGPLFKSGELSSASLYATNATASASTRKPTETRSARCTADLWLTISRKGCDTERATCGSTMTLSSSHSTYANALSGIVRDPSGAPLTGATVAEVSQDGTVIESTTTDQVGSFAIVPRAKKKVYDLKISLDPNFNPLIVHVRVSRWTKKLLDLKLEVST